MSPICGFQTAQKIMRVQRGAWNLSGTNKTSVVLSCVERAHLSTRHIQRTSHPVVAVHTKRVERRNPFTQSEYS